MYVNQDGIKNENSFILCENCKYNCKYGGSDYCIRHHHFLTVNTVPGNCCNEYKKRRFLRSRILVV